MTFSRFFLLVLVLVSTAGGVLTGQPDALTGVAARAFDHHVEINWEPSPNPFVGNVRVFGATDDGPFSLVGTAANFDGRLIDFVGAQDENRRYFVRAIGSSGQLGDASDTVAVSTFEMSDSMLLDMVQEYTLRYFFEFGHPTSGMARERNTAGFVTTGGTGFGVQALIVGAERGFITYEQARERTSRIVDFLMTVPRFQGAFAHWLNGRSGAVIPFSPTDDGGDIVETALLLQGLLTAKAYYTGDNAEEKALRDNISQLYAEVNWNWYRQLDPTVLTWHWSPNFGFDIDLDVRGFNETHIVYLLAIAAPNPDFAIPRSLYDSGWVGGNYLNSLRFNGIPLLVGRGKGGPLFYTHYSYIAFDPREKKDAYANYFNVGRNHALIDQAHCIENPYNHAGYGENCWGLTASDDPDGYLAHAPDNPTVDNGTIAPTAALSSMPYTPDESMAALKHFYRDLGDRMWGPFGFYDAFNVSRNWYADSYLAIDQGPIICMIENHRSGLLWDLFMSGPEAERIIERVGFVDDLSTSVEAPLPAFLRDQPSVYPNPATEWVTLSLDLAAPASITIDLLSGEGRVIRRITSPGTLGAGAHQLPLHLRPRLNAGLYYLKINGPGAAVTQPLIVGGR
ncbi:glucoamylase family protein [Lewinella sp. 4G2]|uniref:glucoamylase family protein n=1 Tax=Lewinella sp. 4G2 TaxID=1803372 RepID=UPI0018D4CE86|nr:glucoamylase family protein [Lewinella sp. 4G2]